jgi:hypothetical protein
MNRSNRSDRFDRMGHGSGPMAHAIKSIESIKPGSIDSLSRIHQLSIRPSCLSMSWSTFWSDHRACRWVDQLLYQTIEPVDELINFLIRPSSLSMVWSKSWSDHRACRWDHRLDPPVSWTQRPQKYLLSNHFYAAGRLNRKYPPLAATTFMLILFNFTIRSGLKPDTT